MSLMTTRDGRGVVTLTLDRPARHNALDAGLIDALTGAVQALAADPLVRVVVLTGTGPSFCAGGDLAWMRAQAEASAAARRVEARRLAGLLAALWALPQPLIARVQGAAYGGGLGLIATADHALCLPQARFGLTETRLGLIPATIGPYVLARLGPARAGEIFACPRLVAAGEAQRLGLIAEVVPDLDAAVGVLTEAYLSAAPGAVAAAKALLRTLAPIPPGQIEASVEALARRWAEPEAEAGITAFFAHRPPPWAVDQ